MKREDDVQKALDAGDETRALELARGERHLEELVEVHRMLSGDTSYPPDDGFTAGVMAALDRPLEALDVEALPSFEESSDAPTQGATVRNLASRHPAVWIAAAAAAAGLVATGGLTLWGDAESEPLAYAPAEVPTASSSIGEFDNYPPAEEGAAVEGSIEPIEPAAGPETHEEAERSLVPTVTAEASPPAPTSNAPAGQVPPAPATLAAEGVMGGAYGNRQPRARRSAASMASPRGGSGGGLGLSPHAAERPAQVDRLNPGDSRMTRETVSSVRVLSCVPDDVHELRIVFRVASGSIVGIESTRPSQSSAATRCLSRLFEGRTAPGNRMRTVRRTPVRARHQPSNLE